MAIEWFDCNIFFTALFVLLPSIQFATSSRMPGLTSVCTVLRSPAPLACFISRLMRVRSTRSFLNMLGSLCARIWREGSLIFGTAIGLDLKLFGEFILRLGLMFVFIRSSWRCVLSSTTNLTLKGQLRTGPPPCGLACLPCRADTSIRFRAHSSLARARGRVSLLEEKKLFIRDGTYIKLSSKKFGLYVPINLIKMQC